MIRIESKLRKATDMQPLPSANHPIPGGEESGMTRERRHYQQQVATLLQAIGQGVKKLEGLRARGLRGRALTEQATELSIARRELAELVRAREGERASFPNQLPPHEAPLPGATNRRRPAPPWAPAYR